MVKGTISLKDFEIPIHPEVKEILNKQFQYDNEDDNVAEQQHMNRILEAIKIPPSTSICRVNFSLKNNTREEAISKIQQYYQKNWDIIDAKVLVRPNKDWHDVIEIKVVSSREESSSILSLYDRCIPKENDNERTTPVLFKDWQQRSDGGWPMTHRVVIVDRFCAEAVLRGSHVFVGGILCADMGIRKNEIVAVYGYVGEEKKTKPTRGTTMSDYLDLNNNNNRPPCLFLGMGKTHCARAIFFSATSGIGVSMTLERATANPAPPLHGLAEECGIFVQNFPSILVGHALDPQPGDVILDMCAAPGGKTTHLASLLRNDGLVVACEKSQKKVTTMRELVKGMTCILPLALDSTKCVLQETSLCKSIREIFDSVTNNNDDDISSSSLDINGFSPDSFDRILLDPPCSALGLRPKLSFSNTKAKDLEKHAEYQRRFVDQAIQLLKPGGIMTYSTCTINALENEANVAFILEKYSHCMELLPLPSHFPGQKGLSGHGLTNEQRSCVRRFDPSDTDSDCMGFFIAKLRKKATHKRKLSS